MATVKLKLNSYIDTGAIRSLQNEFLLLESQCMIFMIKHVKFNTQEETFGRKKKKTRNVQYLTCEIVTWSESGHFISSFDAFNTRRLLERNLMNMRRSYIDFRTGWFALHEMKDNMSNQ